MTGEDFSYADIRGANFAEANLSGANFTGVKAGLQWRWAALQVAVSCLLSGMLTFASVHLYSDFITYYFFPDISLNSDQELVAAVAGTFILFAFGCVFFSIISNGLTIEAVPGISFAVLIASTVASIVISTGGLHPSDSRPAAPGLGAILVVIAVVISVAIAGIRIGFFGIIVGAGAGIVHVILFLKGKIHSGDLAELVKIASFTVFITLVTAWLGGYVDRQAAINDERFSLVRTFSVAFAAIRGTSFRKAILDQANFTSATLQNTNFREASLVQTCWYKAKKLNRAPLGNSILSKRAVRELLVTHNGYKKDYTNANLNGADLSGVNLEGANLRGTNLSNATLKHANLTGACLEDWRINQETVLKGVVCEYVYLKQGEQERRPSSGSFKPGEFALLFQKALATVDLIFADGIDWQAFFQSFQELRSQYSEDNLSIQAIEKKSGGAFVIRLEVPAEADKAAIECQAKELYEMKLQLQEERYRSELQAKDGQISIYQEQLEFHRQNNTNLIGIVQTMAEKETSNITNDLRGASIANFSNQLQDNASQTASNFTQNINTNIGDIAKLINSLRDTAQTFPEQQREEVLVHLDDLQEDLSQPEKQKPERIKTRLVALFAIASTASGVVVGATDFGNKVLDLSKKLGIELVHPPSNPQLPLSK